MKDDKKKKLIITIVGVLILLIATIGASFAYFTSNISSTGNNKIDASTVVLASARMDFGDKVVANGIFPGHKILKTITVTGSGSDDAEPITATIILTPDVTNFGTHVKYTIYAVENSTIDNTTICEEAIPTNENGMYYDTMECDTSSLGTPIMSGTFEGKKVVTKEIEVTSTTNTTYYLIIEYVNDPNGQDEEQGKTFTINIDFKATYNGASIEQTFIINGEEVYDLPTKQEYYEVAVTCSDNVARTWNYETWSLNIEEDLEESCHCSLEFNKNANKYVECIGKESGNLVYDETVDNNLRYIGENPKNYVNFNCVEDENGERTCEKWRIIGFMNNIEDSEGNKGSHIKIIRDEPIGTYSWDNKANGVGSSTSQYGSNDWTDSALMTVLNKGIYYNRTSGTCPYGKNGATTACDFSESGLTNEAKNMISSVVWNLGGHSTNVAKASKFYIAERGEATYENSRETIWEGKIGLMYPSDYGYAVGGSVRDTCLSANLSNYYNNNCYTNDWLYKVGSGQWTLMPRSSDAYSVFYVSSSGRGDSNGVCNDSYAVRPVLYLNSNIEIIADDTHDGSSNHPYELKLAN